MVYVLFYADFIFVYLGGFMVIICLDYRSVPGDYGDHGAYILGVRWVKKPNCNILELVSHHLVDRRQPTWT